MIVLYQRQRLSRTVGRGEKKQNEEPGFETEDLEGYARSGPHRVRLDGWFRGRGRRRDHARRRNQHQHDLLEDRVRDVERCCHR
jgi:hypothetical protein